MLFYTGSDYIMKKKQKQKQWKIKSQAIYPLLNQQLGKETNGYSFSKFTLM